MLGLIFVRRFHLRLQIFNTVGVRAAHFSVNPIYTQLLTKQAANQHKQHFALFCAKKYYNRLNKSIQRNAKNKKNKKSEFFFSY